MLIKLFLLLSAGVVCVKCLNVELLGQSFLYGIAFLAREEGNSSECHRHLSSLFESVDLQRRWALKALDASGRPAAGFFYGNNLWLGSVDQCGDLSNKKPFEISYEVVKTPKPTPFDYPPFDLGFFTALIEHNSSLQQHMQMPFEFTIQVGLCVPKSCSAEDLSHLLTNYIDRNYLTVQNLYDLDLNLTRVRTIESSSMWLLALPKTIILLLLLSVVIGLSIAGTCYDMRQHNLEKNLTINQTIHSKQQSVSNVSTVELVSAPAPKNSALGDILHCFSINANIKNLMSTDLPADSMRVIHGLKFFAMLWVIMVHSVFYQCGYITNMASVFRLSEDLPAQILSNSTYSVDTFFFLSGFLVSYLFFKSKKNTDGQRTNYGRKVSEFFMMFVNRFMRLTPVYVFIIIFSDVMYTYYSRNSVLSANEPNDVMCPKYWWRNILYINNLYPRSEMCLSWSWYLSADTQFFVVATFLLILSTIVFKVAAALTVLLVVCSILAASYTSYVVSYIPTMDEQLVELDTIYDMPWNRIGPYLVGVITAYIFFVKMQGELVLKKKTRIILWVVFPLLNLWILFTIYTRKLSVEFSAFYMGTSRTLWGIGIAWVVIASSTGNAKLLGRFLSFPGWIPLSRLTYCAYLINPVLANMVYMGSNAPINGSRASFGLSAQGIAMGTYFMAFFVSVLIESPGILLTKMLFKKLLTKPKSTVNGA